VSGTSGTSWHTLRPSLAENASTTGQGGSCYVIPDFHGSKPELRSRPAGVPAGRRSALLGDSFRGPIERASWNKRRCSVRRRTTSTRLLSPCGPFSRKSSSPARCDPAMRPSRVCGDSVAGGAIPRDLTSATRCGRLRPSACHAVSRRSQRRENSTLCEIFTLLIRSPPQGG
jgi:hypothetical protein